MGSGVAQAAWGRWVAAGGGLCRLAHPERSHYRAPRADLRVRAGAGAGGACSGTAAGVPPSATPRPMHVEAES